jgi:Ni/Co efflux regulator RcnB
MLKRIIASTFVSGMMLLAAPHAAFADGRHSGGDDRKSEHQDNGQDRGRDHGQDRGHDRDDYQRAHGYDDNYYRSYGSGCNGYRDGYYYGRDGRPYTRDGRPYYRRNADCDNYYNSHGAYYGEPYCDSYDSQTGYCG